MNMTRRAGRIAARGLAIGAAATMLGTVTLTASAGTASAAPVAKAAQARQERPVYRCEHVRHEEHSRRVEGFRCFTHDGRHEGFVREPIIEGWRDGRFEGRFACEFGEANLPERIVGHECRAIFG